MTRRIIGEHRSRHLNRHYSSRHRKHILVWVFAAVAGFLSFADAAMPQDYSAPPARRSGAGRFDPSSSASPQSTDHLRERFRSSVAGQRGRQEPARAEPGRTGTSDGAAGLWTGRFVCGRSGLQINIAIVDLFGSRHALVNVLEEALPFGNPRRTRTHVFAAPGSGETGRRGERWRRLGGTAGTGQFDIEPALQGGRLVADVEGCRDAQFTRVQPRAASSDEADYIGTWSGQFETCRGGDPKATMAARMTLVAIFPGEYYLDAEYDLDSARTGPERLLTNRQIFLGRWDDSARKIAFQGIAHVPTKQNGEPNARAHTVIGMHNITLEYDSKEKRLFGTANLCPFGQFSREGAAASVGTPDAATAGQWLGEWQGYAQCGDEKAVPVTLELAQSSLQRLKGVVEYVDRQSLGAGVVRQLIVGESTPDGNGYTFSVERLVLQVSKERVPTGFTLSLRPDGPYLVGAHSGPPCTSFQVERVRADSPWRQPTVQAPASGGTFYSSRRPADRCAAYAAWFRKPASEYPDLASIGIPGQGYPKMVLLFADEDFVPVFGKPFDMLHQAKRMEIAEEIRTLCNQDEFRDRHLERFGRPSMIFQQKIENPSSNMGTTAIFAVIREARRLRGTISWTLENLPDSTGYSRAAAILVPLEQHIQENVWYLWPSEQKAVIARIKIRLGKFALVEAENNLRRIDAIADPAARLPELRSIFAGEPAYKNHLLEADGTALNERILASQRALSEGLIGPTLAAIEDTGIAEGALDRVEAMTRDVEPVMALLVDVLASEYRKRIEQKHQQVLESLIDQRLSRLRSYEPTRNGLSAGARWLAELQTSFGRFESAAVYRKAVSEFPAIRNRQLREALATFEAELGQVPNDSGRSPKVSAMLGDYLSWEGDDRLPSSLEYRLVAEQH